MGMPFYLSNMNRKNVSDMTSFFYLEFLIIFVLNDEPGMSKWINLILFLFDVLCVSLMTHFASKIIYIFLECVIIRIFMYPYDNFDIFSHSKTWL